MLRKKKKEIVSPRHALEILQPVTVFVSQCTLQFSFQLQLEKLLSSISSVGQKRVFLVGFRKKRIGCKEVLGLLHMCRPIVNIIFTNSLMKPLHHSLIITLEFLPQNRWYQPLYILFQLRIQNKIIKIVMEQFHQKFYGRKQTPLIGYFIQHKSKCLCKLKKPCPFGLRK